MEMSNWSLLLAMGYLQARELHCNLRVLFMGINIIEYTVCCCFAGNSEQIHVAVALN